MTAPGDIHASPTRDRENSGRRPARPLVYDATHLTTRLGCVATTGIDFVDRVYARYLTTNRRIACGIHYGGLSPHVLAPDRVARISSFHERKLDRCVSPDEDASWRRLRAWLTRAEVSEREMPCNLVRPGEVWARIEALALQLGSRLAHDRSHRIPDGAVYLNIAQHAFEYHTLFRWLDRRRDLVPVFLVHDMLPLDYPEYFRDGYEQRFRRRVETILRYARAIITTSRCTAQRIEAEFASRGRRMVPIHVQSLASPLECDVERARDDPALASSPYFVVISTIEPRKNHLMLLHVWRSLAAAGAGAAKLVCVGLRGRNSSLIIETFERSVELGLHIRAISGVSSAALRSLLANARALLLPSFAEGYGVPLVEALSLGTPVICSDIPVFHEVTQDCATFLSPLDGAAWRDTLRHFAREDSPMRDEAVRAAGAFVKPTWAGYFQGVETFVSSL